MLILPHIPKVSYTSSLYLCLSNIEKSSEKYKDGVETFVCIIAHDLSLLSLSLCRNIFALVRHINLQMSDSVDRNGTVLCYGCQSSADMPGVMQPDQKNHCLVIIHFLPQYSCFP